jgi:hypothetical protein
MTDEITPLGAGEVAVVPIPGRHDLVLAIGQSLKDPGEPVGKGVLDAVLEKGGLLGGAMAAQGLLDGSLVRLAPETVTQIKNGAVFLKDKQGFALGTLKNAGDPKFRSAVRFLPGAANPVAAGLMLQTMALQHQLGEITEALEQVNAKLDLLLLGTHHAVLAELRAVGHQLDELRTKAAQGHEFTSADEVKVRDYEDASRGRANEAELWLSEFRVLLTTQSLSLRAHHDQLEALLEKHVAFWLRVWVTAKLSLAQSRLLRLHGAATSESQLWAEHLDTTVQADVAGIVSDLVMFANDLDAYLRRHDIASGLAELSFSRKATVRRLRRELGRTHEALRVTLAEAVPMIQRHRDPLPELPAPLRRRDFEPHPVRDNLGTASRVVVRTAREVGSWTAEEAVVRFDQAGRLLQERRSSERRGPSD